MRQQVFKRLPEVAGAVRTLRVTRKPFSAVAYGRVLICVIFCAGLLCSAPRSLSAQQGSVPSKLPSAEKIVDSYLNAIGGKKRVATIRDATYDWEICLKDQTMGIAKTQIKIPSSVRAELTFGNGQIVSVANPRSAWIFGLDGRLHTLTDEEAGVAKLQAVLDSRHFVDYKKSNVLARVVSIKDAEPGPAYVVEFSLRSGARLKYLFSTTTKLLVAIEDDARKTTTQFEDYRPEGNVLEPHRVRLNIRNSGELTLLLQRATYNTGIPDSTFDPPRAAEALDVPALLREVSLNQK